MQPFQQAQDFFIAFLHPVAGPGGPVIGKRGCINGFNVQLFGAEQRVHQGKLVIDFVIGIRVQHHAHFFVGNWSRWSRNSLESAGKVMVSS